MDLMQPWGVLAINGQQEQRGRGATECRRVCWLDLDGAWLFDECVGSFTCWDGCPLVHLQVQAVALLEHAVFLQLCCYQIYVNYDDSSDLFGFQLTCFGNGRDDLFGLR